MAGETVRARFGTSLLVSTWWFSDDRHSFRAYRARLMRRLSQLMRGGTAGFRNMSVHASRALASRQPESSVLFAGWSPWARDGGMPARPSRQSSVRGAARPRRRHPWPCPAFTLASYVQRPPGLQRASTDSCLVRTCRPVTTTRVAALGGPVRPAYAAKVVGDGMEGRPVPVVSYPATVLARDASGSGWASSDRQATVMDGRAHDGRARTPSETCVPVHHERRQGLSCRRGSSRSRRSTG